MVTCCMPILSICTEKLIEEYITPRVIGFPALLDVDRINDIWKVQKEHVLKGCLSDVPNVQLYGVTREMVRGGVTLPVYRCARGTTSLESFHLHLNTFIPGMLLGCDDRKPHGYTNYPLLIKEAYFSDM